jgi:hypothetical protein
MRKLAREPTAQLRYEHEAQTSDEAALIVEQMRADLETLASEERQGTNGAALP